jgi:hypothetical protein
MSWVWWVAVVGATVFSSWTVFMALSLCRIAAPADAAERALDDEAQLEALGYPSFDSESSSLERSKSDGTITINGKSTTISFDFTDPLSGADRRGRGH